MRRASGCPDGRRDALPDLDTTHSMSRSAPRSGNEAFDQAASSSIADCWDAVQVRNQIEDTNDVGRRILGAQARHCPGEVVYSALGEGAIMGEVRTVTREALIAERAKLLRALGRDEDALRADAVLGALSGDEWYALERLDAIAFLLGESKVVAA